jgi:hypothetical protein
MNGSRTQNPAERIHVSAAFFGRRQIYETQDRAKDAPGVVRQEFLHDHLLAVHATATLKLLPGNVIRLRRSGRR